MDKSENSHCLRETSVDFGQGVMSMHLHGSRTSGYLCSFMMSSFKHVTLQKHPGLASSGPSWTTEAGVSNSLAPALQQLFPFEQTGRGSKAEEAPSEHEQVSL